MFDIAMILGKNQKVAAFSFYGELKTMAAYFQGIRYNAESIQVHYFILYIVRPTRLYSSVPQLETGTPKLFGVAQNE